MSIKPLPPADFVPSIQGYSGQGAFRFWCQTVLPLVYDDSLSYYELLNKVVHYLNNIIKDVSTLEDNYQLLYEAFVLLQKYVNTYFDSLDVQEEINHKLDQMVCDGTFDRLLEKYLKNSVKYFDTAITMKESTKVVAGDIVITGGYYNINDGGKGIYHITEKNEEIENGGSIIFLNNDLIANLIPENNNVINIKQWGAKTDGSYCDEYYNNCVTYIKNNFPISYQAGDRGKGGATIYFPIGTYKFENRLEAYGYIKIKGENQYQTIITSDADYCFYFNTDDYTQEDIGRQWNFEVDNITFLNCHTVIYLITCDNSKITNSRFLNCETGIYFMLPVNMHIDHCSFYTCTTGIHVRSVGVGPGTTTYITNCWIAHCTTGLYSNYGTNGIQPLVLKNNIFEYNNKALSALGSETYLSYLILECNYFEGNTTRATFNHVCFTLDETNHFDPTDPGYEIFTDNYTIIIINDVYGKSLFANYRGKIILEKSTGYSINSYKGTITDNSRTIDTQAFSSVLKDSFLVHYSSTNGFALINFNKSTNTITNIAGNITATFTNNNIVFDDSIKGYLKVL